MKTALLALLFLAAMVAVEARPKKGGSKRGPPGGGGDRCGAPGGGPDSDVFEALADDNGVLEWFFLEEDDDDCASPANAESPNEITIEAREDREGRKRGG